MSSRAFGAPPAMATGHLGCSAIEVFGFSRMVLPPHDALKTFDREMLMRIRQELIAHKREVDKAVLRLSFVDEQQLN